VIIDGFLYHGDLNHAINKQLLEELDNRHIISVCDSSLEQDILDQFHVSWIDLDDDFCTDISQHFETTNEFLQSSKAKRDKALAHCLMGISRLSSIVLAYLLKFHIY
jgi:protein-tyrosine phosphatase